MITTALDTLLTRDPCLAEVMYRGSKEDQTYLNCVDLKSHSISKYPDRIVTHNVAGLGPMQSRHENGVIQMDVPGPADTKETVYSKFGIGVEFTEDFSDDCMYGVQQDVIEDVGRSYNKTRNIQTGQLYDNAFNTTYYTSGDGKAILATDHTAYMGGAARANCPTIDQTLSYEGLQTVITLAMQQTDDRGVAAPAFNIGEGFDLIIPPSMFFAASRILDKGSAYEPNSNNNAINTLNTNFDFRIVVNPYLTSATNWFLTKRKEKGIWLVDRIPLTKSMYQVDSTKGAVWDARGRWAFHIKTWENIYGSKG